MLRLRSLLLVVGLLALLAGSASAAPRPTAEKAPLVTFGVGPVGSVSTTGRAVFRYTAPPGAVLLDRVAVVNQSDQPLTLLVYPSDAFTDSDGTLSIAARDQPNSAVGSWIALGAQRPTGATGRAVVRVTVPPQSSRGRGEVRVPLRLSVPLDAEPGEHVGGVAVALLTKSTQGAQLIDLEQRVVSRVYVTVPGQRVERLAVQVTGTDFDARGIGLTGDLAVSYRVRNTGTTRVGAEVSANATPLLGLPAVRAQGSPLVELLPGSSVRGTVVLRGVPATVWGTAWVTVTPVAAPLGAPPVARALQDSEGYDDAWPMPLLLIIVVVVLLWRARRRWRRRRAVSGQPVVGARSRAPAQAALALVVCSLAAALLPLLAPTAARAAARDLGPVEVSPVRGDDQTLVDGVVRDAACPRGTSDSFWQVVGPGLAADGGFVAQGTREGRGYQFFHNLSIANLRTTNNGSFTSSASYRVVFRCIGDGGETLASYGRDLRYTAGGRGAFRFAGYGADARVRPLLPAPPEAGPGAVGVPGTQVDGAYAVDPTFRPSPAASRPRAARPEPSATSPGPSGTADVTPAPSAAAPAAQAGGRSPAGPAAGAGALVALVALVALLTRRRRTASAV